jgi:hypothetical protein
VRCFSFLPQLGILLSRDIYVFLRGNVIAKMSDIEKSIVDPKSSERGGDTPPVSVSQIRQRRPWWKLGGKDISFAPVEPASVSTSASGSIKEDLDGDADTNVRGTVFDDFRAAELYAPGAKYEGAHRFDPNATWTQEEENKLIRNVSIELRELIETI